MLEFSQYLAPVMVTKPCLAVTSVRHVSKIQYGDVIGAATIVAVAQILRRQLTRPPWVAGYARLGPEGSDIMWSMLDVIWNLAWLGSRIQDS